MCLMTIKEERFHSMKLWKFLDMRRSKKVRKDLLNEVDEDGDGITKFVLFK